MPSPSVEERLSRVESELTKIKQRLEASNSETTIPWWEKIAGTFADSDEYDQAMRRGREYRESLRPKSEADAA
jgi:hypothetical protein